MGNHSKSETVFKVSIYSSRYRVGIGRVPIMGNHSKSETVFKVTIYSSRYRVGIGSFTIMGNHSWLTTMVPQLFGTTLNLTLNIRLIFIDPDIK